MGSTIRRIDPRDIAAASGVEDFTPRVDAAEWELIEDAPQPEAEHGQRRSSERRAYLIIALAGMIVGLGFAGRNASPDRGDGNASADAAIVLDGPAAGATVDGATVAFRGLVRRDLGAVEVAVVLGGLVLGRTTVPVTANGPISGSVEVFAPPTAIEVQLIATIKARGQAGDFAAEAVEPTVSRAVTLRPAGPVGMWPVRVVRSRGHALVIVSGCAPLGVSQVTVRITNRGGAHVGEAIADVTPRDSVDGSTAAVSLGLGSFEARLVLTDPVPVGRLSVEVAWSDAATGSWGSSWIPVTVSSGTSSLHD